MQTVRDGQKVWPFCGSCGCRLQFTPLKQMDRHFYVFSHFGFNHRSPFTDAQNHWCNDAKFQWVAPVEKVYLGV